VKVHDYDPLCPPTPETLWGVASRPGKLQCTVCWSWLTPEQINGRRTVCSALCDELRKQVPTN